MPPGFCQKHWDVVGTDVCNGVRSMLHSGCMLWKINYTHITLIPKVRDPKEMTQLSPLSLCNVIYKIVAKVITNKLKRILPRIISLMQSAFVPGRLISDNTLVAGEIAYSMHKRKSGWNSIMALKLDISKAYDRLEWNFLEEMMRCLGFNENWIRMVMLCISTVTDSFKVNGEQMGLVSPKRGIRQGCPLSPDLFVICVEGLSALLRNGKELGLIHGVSVCKNAPRYFGEMPEHQNLAAYLRINVGTIR